MAIMGLVFNFLGVAATSIGFYFVVRQINLTRAVAKADFIVRLEQKFVDFAPTYRKFLPDGDWSSDKIGPGEKDYTEVVTYLDFIATFPLLMKIGIIDFETIDSMFGHRFFMTMNNKHVKQLLLKNKTSWKNLLGLYKDWKQFKFDHNMPILQNDHIWNPDETHVDDHIDTNL